MLLRLSFPIIEVCTVLSQVKMNVNLDDFCLLSQKERILVTLASTYTT
jgi:hypothetical protein